MKNKDKKNEADEKKNYFDGPFTGAIYSNILDFNINIDELNKKDFIGNLAEQIDLKSFFFIQCLLLKHNIKKPSEKEYEMFLKEYILYNSHILYRLKFHRFS